MNVVEPVKVTRSTLQNAALVASLFLTTEAVVADKPEPQAPVWEKEIQKAIDVFLK